MVRASTPPPLTVFASADLPPRAAGARSLGARTKAVFPPRSSVKRAAPPIGLAPPVRPKNPALPIGLAPPPLAKKARPLPPPSLPKKARPFLQPALRQRASAAPHAAGADVEATAGTVPKAKATPSEAAADLELPSPQASAAPHAAGADVEATAGTVAKAKATPSEAAAGMVVEASPSVSKSATETVMEAEGTESSSVSGNPAVPTSVKAETMLPALDVVMSLQAALPHLSRAAAADVKAALQALGTPLTLEAGLSSSKVSADAVVEASSSCATTSKVPAGTAIEASSSSSKVSAEAVVEANSSCATTSKVPAGTAMEVSPSSVKSAAGAVVEATGGTATKASSSVSKLAAETVVEVVTLELRSLEQRLNYGSVSAGAMDEAKEAMAKELAEQQVQLEQRREEVVKLEESLEVAQAREGLATAWQLYCEHFADGQCDVASKTDDFLRDFLTRALS
ncbi:unnamed protein product [Cladocopium goreaui]|uniref:Uncharacterized protein n=1 Tax=Cladocopium goreaui TaxID=2562237 RepID=A0A9P1G1J6_9DINO|nr:unnamed protein product [Cladocopium goreaui]